ncbi:MAG: hypothetical protein JJE36_03690 [Coriobacteriia bacterium]|nr:hypothetical protein [Coriobacteriia bacterium]
MSDSGTKAGVHSDSWSYRLGRWWRRHPIGRWVAVGAVALLFVVALAIPGTPNEPSDTIAMPASSSDLKGDNYKDVVTKLKSAGFASIDTTSMDDLVTGWLTKDGEVERVSVNGETEFDADSRFPKGAKIVITYHTFPTKELEKAAESSPAPEPGEAAKSSPVPDEPTPSAASTSDLAKRTETAYLAAFGVDSIDKLGELGGVEDTLVPFIVSFEDAGWDTVKVTVQTNNVTEGELKQTAMAIHSLIGEQIKDLNRVEVWTANGELYGASNRAEVPMLNQ